MVTAPFSARNGEPEGTDGVEQIGSDPPFWTHSPPCSVRGQQYAQIE